MNYRIGWMGLTAATALVGACAGDGVQVGGRSGNLQINVAPLTVPGPVSTASYTVKVEVLGEGGTYTTFQEFAVDTAKGSSGQGQFIGTCLASDDGTPVAHRATITLVAADDADGNSLLDGCEGDTVQVRYFDCLDGGDAKVNSEFHLMCDLARGFSDFTFQVDNVYCQTKIDCPEEPLLYDAAIDERVRTMVVGVQCSKDPGGSTDFDIPVFIEMRCDDLSGIPSDPSGTGDVDVTTNPRFIVEAYEGQEQIEAIKFKNLAYSLTPEAFTGASKCQFTVTTWPEELIGGAFVGDEVRLEAAIVLMTTTLVVGPAKVTCEDTQIETTVVPVLTLQGGTNALGKPMLNAVAYSFGGKEDTVTQPVCYQEARDNPEDGWEDLRRQALASFGRVSEANTMLVKLIANRADVEREGKTAGKAFDAAIDSLQDTEAIMDTGIENIQQFNNRFGQNNMAVQTGYCANYSQISEQFNQGFDQVALLSALRKYRLFTIPKIEQGLNALSDTVSEVDGLYSEFIADYNGNGQFAALVYADAKDAVVGLKNANRVLESSLAIDRLTNDEIINALAALRTNCSQNVGGAVNLLLGAVETMKDEISGEVLNQQTALDAYQSNLMSQLERLDSDIEEQTLTVETAADDFKRQKTAAVAGYVAMADNCETRSYALRIARGIYNGNMVLGFTNTTNQLFGSEAEMRDQPTVVGFCQEGAESLLAFKSPDKADQGRYTADNGARTFNSIVSYKADGGSGVMAIEGQFAFNHLGSGLEPMCGSSYLAYSGRFSSAPVTLD